MLALVTALLDIRWRWFAVAAVAVALVSPISAAGGSRKADIAGRISAGDDHTCEVTPAGAAMCWGGNTSGELGSAAYPGSKKPVVVTGLSKGVVSIAAGDAYSCALTSGGGIKCWGDNENGALGHPGADGAKPVDVAGLTSGAVAVAVDTGDTCAITSGGGVKCWGYNGNGEVGDGTHVNRKTPVAVAGLASGVTAIGIGGAVLGDHSCVLTTGGGVKCWGYNGDGALGDGTETNRPKPVAVSGLSHGVVAIAVGGDHDCAVTSGGAVECWGDNLFGQLGTGTTDSSETPVAVSGLTSGVRAIAAGGSGTCALLRNRAVECWGYNADGELGDGTHRSRSVPTPVAGLTGGVAAITVGSYHSCALSESGAIKCWGSNDSGDLGDGTAIDRRTPVEVK
jgi:alpha-tubulin suppressor-like RCC1 family protein